MRLARLAVQHPLAAIDAADRAEDRPVEAFIEEGCRRLPLLGGGDAFALGLDARQFRFRGLDLVLRQIVDALDLVLTLRDGEFAGFDHAAGHGHFQHRPGRRIAAEAEQEPAVAVDLDVYPIERRLAAGVGLAHQQPALDVVAVERHCRAAAT